jgi:hypothetical protein
MQNVLLRTGAMERNGGRNERNGIQDTEAARRQEGGGKSVTNCGAQRSTTSNAAATIAFKVFKRTIVAAALVWRIFFYRRLTERDLITLQRGPGRMKGSRAWQLPGKDLACGFRDAACGAIRRILLIAGRLSLE